VSTATLTDPVDLGTRRELNRRRSCGITVCLYWDEFDGQLSVSVTDDADPSRDFTVEVSADQAASGLAFEHPFLFEPDRPASPQSLVWEDGLPGLDELDDDDGAVVA
jgi:hypothetical protein